MGPEGVADPGELSDSMFELYLKSLSLLYLCFLLRQALVAMHPGA